MASKRRRHSPPASDSPPRGVPARLPRGALRQVKLGHGFAEYDKVLTLRDVIVKTQPILEVDTQGSNKCLFVGRRGTGKTATALYLHSTHKRVYHILPRNILFDSGDIQPHRFRDTRQPPFKTLLLCFKTCLLLDTIRYWIDNEFATYNALPDFFLRYRNQIEQLDFDLRLLAEFETALPLLDPTRKRAWLKYLNQYEQLETALSSFATSHKLRTTLLIDRIDDAWDGSDSAVIALMAIMHACVELTASSSAVRPLLFVRENLFERVRQIDNEFARLETAVVSLDWTKVHLRELIERRLNAALIARFPVDGTTWNAFFEEYEGRSSFEYVASFCQERPRDLLTFCEFAIANAVTEEHSIVQIEDIQSARKRFSDSRLKDIADEYAENFPRLDVVLSRFYGLGQEFTLAGVSSFISKLIADPEVQRHCADWLNFYTVPAQFIELLYSIGFAGIRRGDRLTFRSVGARSTIIPTIDQSVHLVIHETFSHALRLQEVVVSELDATTSLQTGGLIAELPDGVSLTTYVEQIEDAEQRLIACRPGSQDWRQYESIVGDVIRLCFFRALVNVHEQSREVEGTVRRDWVASNRSPDGFWEMVRGRFQATQVIWECKNKVDLDPADFLQVGGYLTEPFGRFGVLCFRGSLKQEYYRHIKRLSDQTGAVVLPLTDRDLTVFLRQAKNQKVKESHIHELYDAVIRAIS